jgi:(p)ppGpp synthase/HD superfamily hydrolase
MSKLTNAVAYAAAMHDGQTDKAGAPYILHPMRVASSFDLTNEHQRVVAVLHDVIEDTSADWSSVAANFGDDVADDVELLSHLDRDEPYIEGYIARIASSGNVDAMRVKLADLEDNLNLRRSKVVTEAHALRNAKYRRAKQLLTYALMEAEGRAA